MEKRFNERGEVIQVAMRYEEWRDLRDRHGYAWRDGEGWPKVLVLCPHRGTVTAPVTFTDRLLDRRL